MEQGPDVTLMSLHFQQCVREYVLLAYKHTHCVDYLKQHCSWKENNVEFSQLKELKTQFVLLSYCVLVEHKMFWQKYEQF